MISSTQWHGLACPNPDVSKKPEHYTAQRSNQCRKLACSNTEGCGKTQQGQAQANANRQHPEAKPQTAAAHVGDGLLGVWSGMRTKNFQQDHGQTRSHGKK